MEQHLTIISQFAIQFFLASRTDTKVTRGINLSKAEHIFFIFADPFCGFAETKCVESKKNWVYLLKLAENEA